MVCYMTYQNSTIAHGKRYIWVSLIVFAIFGYLQFKSIDHLLKFGFSKAFSSKHNSTLTRIYLKIIVICGLLFFLYLIGLNLYVYLGDEATRIDFHKRAEFFIFADYSILGVSWGVFLCAGLSLGLSGFLYSIFLLGPLANGITISLALHNWFNGLEFNLSAVFQALLDTSVSDVVSLIVNVIWLSATYLLSGSNKETLQIQS